MEGRDLVRVGTVDEYQRNPNFAQESDRAHQHGLSLYPDQPRGGNAENAWGMAIDLNRCIGCVPASRHARLRTTSRSWARTRFSVRAEMHWLRIDRYYEGDDASNPATYFQACPVHALREGPCELVCPVGQRRIAMKVSMR